MQIRSVFWALEEAILQIYFSKVNLSTIVMPRSLSELEISRSSSHEVNGGWGILEWLIVIECVLCGLSFILLVEHHDWILIKSLLKQLAIFIQSEGDATSAYKVMSST